jgi:hypothetical protein
MLGIGVDLKKSRARRFAEFRVWDIIWDVIDGYHQIFSFFFFLVHLYLI